MIKIVLVEDDRSQVEIIQNGLEKEFAIGGIVVERIATELEFRKRLDELAQFPPTLVIMDVMVRWSDPSPDMELPPEDILKEGHYRAGLRCQALLHRANPRIPVLLYTMLEKNDLPDELTSGSGAVQYLSKEASLEPLFGKIRNIFAASRGITPSA